MYMVFDNSKLGRAIWGYNHVVWWSHTIDDNDDKRTSDLLLLSFFKDMQHWLISDLVQNTPIYCTRFNKFNTIFFYRSTRIVDFLKKTTIIFVGIVFDTWAEIIYSKHS